LDSKRTILVNTTGKINIECDYIETGMVKIGFTHVGVYSHNFTELQIMGTMVFRGKAIIGSSSKICIGKNGLLTLGDNFAISACSQLICYSTFAAPIN
jgi:hypothetical protein